MTSTLISSTEGDLSETVVLDERFQSDFLEFHYPGFWKLDKQEQPGRCSITLQAEETAFWSATLLFDRHNPQDVLQAGCEAFQEDYDNIEMEDCPCDLFPYETFSRKIEFFCHDLVSIAELATFRTGRMTVLLLAQAFDKEWKQHSPTFQKVNQSLMCPFGDETIIS